MTLAMLVSDPLHSLNASPLQADCSAADGANPADAALGDTSSAKPIAGIMKFRIVFMNFSCLSFLMMRSYRSVSEAP
jgi:hypothetical protein